MEQPVQKSSRQNVPVGLGNIEAAHVAGTEGEGEWEVKSEVTGLDFMGPCGLR